MSKHWTAKLEAEKQYIEEANILLEHYYTQAFTNTFYWHAIQGVLTSSPRYACIEYDGTTNRFFLSHCPSNPTWRERIFLSDYAELGNCTLHWSWPFLRPPMVPIFKVNSNPYFGLWYACCVGLSLSAWIPGWHSFFLLVLIPYACAYRYYYPDAIAELWRDKLEVK